MVSKWIQKASNPRKKGALHKQLGISLDKKIPKATLHKIVKAKVGSKVHGKTVTTTMKRRALFAINAQKRR
ncbi:MAG: hypothetical protein ABSB71_08015 [Candidatus Bathyarchaeia archaeon]|jgi:hypothetical protein